MKQETKMPQKSLLPQLWLGAALLVPGVLAADL